MSLFSELKRRNVVRVGIAYAVIGWVIAQEANRLAAEIDKHDFGLVTLNFPLKDW